MNITNHKVIRKYLQQIHDHLDFPPGKTSLWEQIQEDILGHIQDAYDNQTDYTNHDQDGHRNESQQSQQLNSILDELGSPATVAQAYLDTEDFVGKTQETSGESLDRRLQTYRRIKNYVKFTFLQTLRKITTFFRRHRRVFLPYFIILLTVYSTLFATNAINRAHNTNSWGFYDYNAVTDIELVDDQLILLSHHPHLLEYNSLRFLSLEDPMNPTLISAIDLPGISSSMKMFNNLIYVLTSSTDSPSHISTQRVHVYDISNISNVIYLGNGPSMKGAYSTIAFVNESLFTYYERDTIFIYSIVNQSIFTFQYQINFPKQERVLDIQVYNDMIFISTDTQFLAYKYTTQLELERVLEFSPGFEEDQFSALVTFQVVDNIAYIISPLEGLLSVDISDFMNPYLLQVTYSEQKLKDFCIPTMALEDDRIFYSNERNQGIKYMDISDPTNMHILGKYKGTVWPLDIQIYKDVIYIADEFDGFHVWNINVFTHGPLYQNLLLSWNLAALASVIFLSGYFSWIYKAERKRLRPS